MSSIVSFNASLLLVNRQTVKSLGIDPRIARCTKPLNNNTYFNTNNSCLRLRKKKILDRRLSVIRASGHSSESIKDENEKDIYSGEILKFESILDFTRLHKSEIEGIDLQTSIVGYRKKLPGSILQPGFQVDLVVVLHRADKEYFADLQQELENYDRVLYEMIVAKDPTQSNRDPATRWMPSEDTKSCEGIWNRSISFVLGLHHQMDCLDYRRDNWYNADLDNDTFEVMLSEAKKKHEDSKLTKEMSDISSEAIPLSPPTDESLDMQPSSFRTAMRLAMAKLFASTESRKDEAYCSVVIEERNKVVMEELRAAMDDGCQKIAILYGSAHMLDMDKRLRTEFDLVPTQISWKTAWSIRNQKISGQKQIPPYSLILAVLVVLGYCLQFKKR